MSSTGECGKCQPIDSKFRRDFKDCNGVCFGKAKLNKCGVCTGGNTGVNQNSGMDACGVCNGDGSSCQGCDGQANSGKKTDLCGSCLDPNDVQFNAGCIKIDAVIPHTAPSSGGTEIVVRGAGFSNPSCSFFDSNSKSYSAELKGNLKKLVIFILICVCLPCLEKIS